MIIFHFNSWLPCVIILIYYTNTTYSQSVQILGTVQVSIMDTVNTGEMVVVRTSDGTLAEKDNRLEVSYFGDTLYNGTNWVIVPGISAANYNLPTDGDGNVYNTVLIGTQMWFKENLRTTKYNDGTTIPLVTGASDWGNLTSPAYCWFNNDSIIHAIPYGALYNYYAVADSNSKNICPLGWHVPSKSEWEVLINYLGGVNMAGGSLKETGTTYWFPPNAGATNSSEFSAVGGGNRNTVGLFDEFGTGGFYYTSTQGNNGTAHYYQLSNESAIIYSYVNLPDIGFSVRCILD